MTERPYCIPILNSYGLRNDRSRSRVAPVDYLYFLSAPVVGTVLQKTLDSINDTEILHHSSGNDAVTMKIMLRL